MTGHTVPGIQFPNPLIVQQGSGTRDFKGLAQQHGILDLCTFHRVPLARPVARISLCFDNALGDVFHDSFSNDLVNRR